MRTTEPAEVDVAVGRFDTGVGVVLPRPNGSLIELDIPEDEFLNLQWQDYTENYLQWLRVMEYDEILDWME